MEELHRDVIQFILDEIESVPHLEALLLIRNSRPCKWSVEDLSRRLYISPEGATALLEDLVRRDLLKSDPAGPAFFYDPPSDEQDSLIARLDDLYRQQLVRVTQLIHSKPSAALRDFARAFRFTKKND